MNAIQRFFYGRYGLDQLGIFSFVLYFLLFVLNLFVKWTVIYVLMVVLLVVMLWRMLSKKYDKRRHENEIFLKVWNPIAQFFKLPFLRIRDRKTHKYVKCPACKKYMRIKKGKGEREINCPLCSNRFSVKS